MLSGDTNRQTIVLLITAIRNKQDVSFCPVLACRQLFPLFNTISVNKNLARKFWIVFITYQDVCIAGNTTYQDICIAGNTT
jgi:hypothetical protein